MKRMILVILSAVLVLDAAFTFVQAAQKEPLETSPQVTEAASPMDQDIQTLSQEWAHIKYEISNGDEQEKQMEALITKSAAVTKKYATHAEPYIWQAIITSTQAGISGGLGALGYAKDSKKLLEQAEAINPRALDGGIYTSLGALYYQVPGWPIGFGDDEKARTYLERARTMNPDAIDPNYFYGEFLIAQGEYAKAIAVLEHALAAPDRPNRHIADKGRRAEVRQAIAMAKKKLGA
ncbi:MAG: tetratricopeptide repeat protein [Nitrospirota bacterium]|nr:tetratricopeptide repeat protein [Nitrospirota bacterium]